MRRLWFVVPLFVVGMCCCSFLMGDDKKPAKEPIYVTKRLPTYYNKLGLSQKQKNDIYKICGRYDAEIQELRQKLKELQDQQKTDCENVLTPEQLARFQQILLGTDRKKGAKAKDTAEAKEKKLDKVAKSKKKEAESKDKDKKTPVEIKK